MLFGLQALMVALAVCWKELRVISQKNTGVLSTLFLNSTYWLPIFKMKKLNDLFKWKLAIFFFLDRSVHWKVKAHTMASTQDFVFILHLNFYEINYIWILYEMMYFQHSQYMKKKD